MEEAFNLSVSQVFRKDGETYAFVFFKQPFLIKKKKEIEFVPRNL